MIHAKDPSNPGGYQPPPRTGECPVCLRDIRLYKGRLVTHGPFRGHLECPGSGRRPSDRKEEQL